MAIVALPTPSNISDAVPVFPGSAKEVFTSDVDVFAGPVTLFVGGSGNVSVLPANGGPAVVFASVAAGTVLPCRIIGLKTTNTTATDFVAVY